MLDINRAGTAFFDRYVIGSGRLNMRKFRSDFGLGRWRRGVIVVLAAMTLVGCGGLPAAGPSTARFANASQDADQGFIVVDLSAQAIAVLAQRPRASLQRQFATRANLASPVIGAGDQIEITIWEAASGGLFSSGGDTISSGSRHVTLPLQAVGADGMLSVPYAGQIRAAGRTSRQIEDAIVVALTSRAIAPQAIVAVRENVSNTVTVTGEGIGGARIALPTATTGLLDVIALAGGVSLPVHQARVTLARNGQSLSVPLLNVMTDPAENIPLQAGDTLTILRDSPSFTVLGATGTNAVLPFDDPAMTLEKAIAKAGGLALANADPSGVFVLRREPLSVAQALDPNVSVTDGQALTNVVYRIDLADPETLFLARQFDILPDDILYVAGALGNSLDRFLRLVGLSFGAARSAAAGI
jgi:polysaccharide biosynthesis/export protein